MTPEEAQKLLDGATPGPLAVCEDRTGWMTITGLSFKIGAALHATDLTYKDRVQRLADADLIAAVHDLARAYIEACGREARAYTAGYVDGATGCPHRVTGQIGVE